MKKYGILIPALNPDEKLVNLIRELLDKVLSVSAIVIVDDGSDAVNQGIFKQVQALSEDKIHVLHHAHNKGKGAALKNGFKYFQDYFPEVEGIATMDSDGQHTVDALEACMVKFEASPSDLVIGVREFTNEIPLRSQFGNILTRQLVKMLTHQNISDTQTGLRIIPTGYAKELIKFPGDRFEFEFDMLLQADKFGIKIIEQSIPTIYLDGNQSSHFRVIRDSIAIYARFFKFAMSGLISFLVDIVLFGAVLLIIGDHALKSIIIATVVSRALSAIVNYALNHHVVFGGSGKFSFIKYGILRA
jgi:glycosyltransferase involved in cell wall biosynthesis